jgi:hypothetical protein
MHNHKIHIECDEFTAPPLLRERDQGLMQFLADAGVPAWKLHKINRVRIYLKVLTISDIATPCGTRLNRDRYDITEPIPVEHSYARWPLQKKPGETAWKYWRTALRLLIVSMSDTQLTVPLGEWTGEPRQIFKWFTRTNIRSLINSPADNEPENQHIIKRAHHNNQSASREFRAQSRDFTAQWQAKKTTALYADVTIRKGTNGIVLHRPMKQYTTPQPPTIAPTVRVGDYVTKLHPFLRQLVPPVSELGVNVTNRTASFISAGSLTARARSPATTRFYSVTMDWSIESTQAGNDSRLIQYKHKVPCGPDESRSKRGVQLGLLAIHVIVAGLKAINTGPPSILLETLSYTVYDWTKHTGPRQGYNCLAKHNTDVGKELQHWMRRTKAEFQEPEDTHHTSDSESDDDTPQCRTRPELNSCPQTEVLYPPASKFLLTIDGNKYNYIPERLLREKDHLPLFRKFLNDNCQLELAALDSVAWELSAAAITTLNLNCLLPVLKFTANEWSTEDKQRHHWDKTEACPFCNVKETMQHVYACNNTAAID